MRLYEKEYNFQFFKERDLLVMSCAILRISIAIVLRFPFISRDKISKLICCMERSLPLKLVILQASKNFTDVYGNYLHYRTQNFRLLKYIPRQINPLQTSFNISLRSIFIIFYLLSLYFQSAVWRVRCRILCFFFPSLLNVLHISPISLMISNKKINY